MIFKREDLADMLGICSTTVWRAIKQLKEVGLIEEKRQGLNRPNLIYIGKIDYSVLEEKEPESIEKEIISSAYSASCRVHASGMFQEEGRGKRTGKRREGSCCRGRRKRAGAGTGRANPGKPKSADRNP